MKRARLQQVEALPNLHLRLAFINGSVHTVDFRPLLAESPGLAPLADERVFAQAKLIEGEDWAVVWPELDIQIGADTLWLDARAQS